MWEHGGNGLVKQALRGAWRRAMGRHVGAWGMQGKRRWRREGKPHDQSALAMNWLLTHLSSCMKGTTAQIRRSQDIPTLRCHWNSQAWGPSRYSTCGEQERLACDPPQGRCHSGPFCGPSQHAAPLIPPSVIGITRANPIPSHSFQHSCCARSPGCTRSSRRRGPGSPRRAAQSGPAWGTGRGRSCSGAGVGKWPER